MNEDNALMDNFKKGDMESFEKLIIKHKNESLRFASRFLEDEYICEDIVQESFADIYVSRDRYKDKFSFKTYLFSIIKYKSIDYLRKKHPIPQRNFVEVESLDNPEKILISTESQNYIIKVINGFKKDYRIVLYLLQHEDFSYKEIGKILGKSPGQVKILIFRARQKLKKALESEGNM